MSNYLAIATVTAALQQMLQVAVGQDVPGVQVTTVRPDTSASSISGPCINIFLYQAVPNPAWRNADLRTRRPKGDLIKHGQAGLDLHYLFTFYGNEQALEPQRLLGSTIRVLVDQPLLTQNMIEECIEHASIPALEGSTLGDQVQRIRFIPSTITTEDLSRIWSVFFQVPYSLSFPYQATAVLIQGERTGQLALPVRQRPTYLSLARPLLNQVEHHPPAEAKQWINTITLGSRITLHGRDFTGEGLSQVQIGKARIRPQRIEAAIAEVTFAELSLEERDGLRAGGPGIQVVRSREAAMDNDIESVVESNVLPFVLCPRIQMNGQGIELTNWQVDEQANRYSGMVTVTVDLLVAPRQRVFLLLNGTAQDTPNTYIFRADRLRSPSPDLHFPIRDVQAGEYLVRVQVDGAESPLHVSDQNAYVGPLLVIT